MQGVCHELGVRGNAGRHVYESCDRHARQQLIATKEGSAMSRLVLVLALLVVGCSAQPTLIDPRSLPVALELGARVTTHEPERFVCTAPNETLVCRPVLALRVHGAERDCACVY